MNYRDYIEDTKKQFQGYNFNQYFNIGLIALFSFIAGVLV